MGSSDKHQCKLCGHETYEIFAYPNGIPAFIPFMAYKKKYSWEGKWVGLELRIRPKWEGKWVGLELRICPKCGHVQGEVLGDD